MTTVRLLALATAAAAALTVLGGTAQSSAQPQPSGSPDTYVTSWDAVGTQSFSAAALSPAEGHTIFAYVAIAVYDSVMAIEGGYEPFAVDVDAPEGASAQAAVAAAATAASAEAPSGASTSTANGSYPPSIAITES